MMRARTWALGLALVGVVLTVRSVSGRFQAAHAFDTAIQNNDSARARDLLAGGVSPNSRLKIGWRPLHFAVASGNIGMAEILLRAGADLEGRDGQDRTPLMLAADQNQGDTVGWLLRHGARVDAQDDSGLTALSRISETIIQFTHNGWDRVGVARLLLNAGANPNSEDSRKLTPLSFAVTRDDHALAEVLLAYGSRPNAWAVDPAAHRDHPHVFEALQVEQRAAPSRPSEWEAAVRNGDLSLVRQLLRQGADPNQRLGLAAGPDGPVTSLGVAVRSARADIAAVLLDAGANPNAQYDDRRTPLQESIESGDAHLARLLLGRGAAPFAAMRGLETPLEHAARCGDLETTRVILDYRVRAYPPASSTRMQVAGPPPGRKQPATGKWSQGELQEALVPAIGFDHEDVVRLLLERGADPNGGPRPGAPLIAAAGSHRLDMVRYLLDAGADPNASESSEATTALGMARLHRQSQIARLLVDHGARLAQLKYPRRRNSGL